MKKNIVKKVRAGFTLIELLVVLVALGFICGGITLLVVLVRHFG